jgi:hypothetical protein
MAPMTDALRAQIRQWAFVDRVPLRVIARQLALPLQTVRGAFVIAGGDGGEDEPPLAALSVAQRATAPSVSGPQAQLEPGLPRRRVAARNL